VYVRELRPSVRINSRTPSSDWNHSLPTGVSTRTDPLCHKLAPSNNAATFFRTGPAFCGPPHQVLPVTAAAKQAGFRCVLNCAVRVVLVGKRACGCVSVNGRLL
jgi:hypothetical protein